MIIKVCSKCKKEKPFSDFYKDKNRKDGFRSSCKLCDKPRHQQYYKKHKDKWPVRNKKYYKLHRKERNQYYAAYAHGMTIAERESFIINKGNRCEVCNISRESHFEIFNKDLCIDHCHKTNINKGVLCCMCNSAAGHLRDNPDLTYKLFEYLERTRKS